jgi:hypothetical protein
VVTVTTRKVIMTSATSTTRKSRATRAADQATAETTATTDQDAIAAALTAAGVSEADQKKMLRAVQPAQPKLNARKIVASALIKVAGDLVESWDHPEVSAEDARSLVSKWMGYLPNSDWDSRLADRSPNGRKPKAETDETETADES